jgi:hypothetical protein
MSPKPTMATTVTVKYSESVPVSVCRLKLLPPTAAIRKYPVAKSRRNSGAVAENASTAREAGREDLAIALT